MCGRHAGETIGPMLERLGSLSAARPRRTLTILFLFIALAGLIGGPLAGKLESDGGFTPGSSESSRAEQQLQQATGVESAPGLVLLVTGGSDDVERTAERLGGIEGVATTAEAGRSEDGDSVLVTGTIRADADDEEVAEATVAAFEDDQD